MMNNLVEKVSTLLLDKGWTLSTAESCTGGMLSSAMTQRAGSSQVFDRGFVTYSNAAKREMLGVEASILETHGAVSLESAAAMSKGALRHSNADIAVSITGIAGPDGGTAEKPVGLVYIGACVKGQDPQVEECYFTGSRENIRMAACEKALSLLIEAIITV